jgi:hypothetical protein
LICFAHYDALVILQLARCSVESQNRRCTGSFCQRLCDSACVAAIVAATARIISWSTSIQHDANEVDGIELSFLTVFEFDMLDYLFQGLILEPTNLYKAKCAGCPGSSGEASRPLRRQISPGSGLCGTALA